MPHRRDAAGTSPAGAEIVQPDQAKGGSLLIVFVQGRHIDRCRAVQWRAAKIAAKILSYRVFRHFFEILG
jgi:hypothetical protein